MAAKHAAFHRAPHPDHPARAAWYAWALLIVVVSLGLGLDLGSKRWAFETVASQPVQVDRASSLADPGYAPIPPHEGIKALPGNLLDFRLVLNSGAVFGIGAHQRWFFIAFSLAAVGVAVFLFGWRTDAKQRLLHVGIAMILAGAIGNLWDRVLLGRVRDFLHMLPGWKLPFGLHWPGGSPEVWPWIFNIADVLLLAGMALVMIDMWWRGRAEAKGRHGKSTNS
jgi:signal peptidase II